MDLDAYLILNSESNFSPKLDFSFIAVSRGRLRESNYFLFFFKSTRITFSLHPHLILLHIDRKLDLKTWLFSLFVQSCILDKERFIFLLCKSRLNSKKIAFRIEITASYTFFVQKSRRLKFLFHWTKHT